MVAASRPGLAASTCTRSAMNTASPIVWVTRIAVVPVSCQMRSSSRFIRWRVISSRAPNGSSEEEHLRAERERAGDRHALLHAAGELCRPRGLEAFEPDERGSATRASAGCPPARRRSRAAARRWRARSARAEGSRPGRRSRSVPEPRFGRRVAAEVIVPALGARISATRRRRVDLPHPDGPISAVKPPDLRSSEMSSTAVTDRPSMSNRLVTWSMMTSAIVHPRISGRDTPGRWSGPAKQHRSVRRGYLPWAAAIRLWVTTSSTLTAPSVSSPAATEKSMPCWNTEGSIQRRPFLAASPTGMKSL